MSWVGIKALDLEIFLFFRIALEMVKEKKKRMLKKQNTRNL